MANTLIRINEFIKRAELEIIYTIEERFSSILNDSLQQLKRFSNLTHERIDPLSSNKFPIQTNRSLVQLISEMLHCFWRLVEVIIEFSYYIKLNSTYDSNQLNNVEISLLSRVDLLNTVHRKRCDFLSQTPSPNLLTDFDQEIFKELDQTNTEIHNLLTTIHLPDYTIGIIRNT